MYGSSSFGERYIEGFFESLKIIAEHKSGALLVQDGLRRDDSCSSFCAIFRTYEYDTHRYYARNYIIDIWISRKRADAARNPFLMFHDAAQRFPDT